MKKKYISTFSSFFSILLLLLYYICIYYISLIYVVLLLLLMMIIELYCSSLSPCAVERPCWWEVAVCHGLAAFPKASWRIPSQRLPSLYLPLFRESL